MTKFISFTEKPLTLKTFFLFASDFLNDPSFDFMDHALKESRDKKDELSLYEIGKIFEEAKGHFGSVAK
ncbi:hypothetical protein [Staphylococcus chromogenes]|uniref:hypothetical protein n=1 Tax=Staphylococcus chromogenes TaxID=46126 RepID=UPI0034DAE6C4